MQKLRALLFLIIGVSFLISLASASYDSGWHNITIDEEGFYSEYSSLKFSNNGQPAISYISEDATETYPVVNLAWHNSANPSDWNNGWNFVSIDEGIRDSSLAFMESGKPVICYNSYNISNTLKIAWHNSANPTDWNSGWNIINCSSAPEGKYTLLFNPLSGFPLIVNSGQQLFIWHDNADPSDWSTGWKTIEMRNDTTHDTEPIFENWDKFTSFCFNPITGTPAFCDYDNSKLRIAWHDSTNPEDWRNGWNTYTDGENSYGQFASLAFNPSDGKPRIIYTNNQYDEMRLFWHESANPSDWYNGWNKVTVTSDYNDNPYITISIDPVSVTPAVVSYFLNYYCPDSENWGDDWNSINIDDERGTGFSFVFSDSGTPAISYHGGSNDLKFAWHDESIYHVKKIDIVPEHPEFWHEYSINITIYNPNTNAVTKTISVEQECLQDSFELRTIYLKNFTEENINPSGYSQFNLNFYQMASPFAPLWNAANETGWASVKNNTINTTFGMILSEAGNFEPSLKVLDAWLTIDKLNYIFNEGYGCKPDAKFEYTFIADEDIRIVPNSWIVGEYPLLNGHEIPVTVRARHEKYEFFREAILSDTLSIIFTTTSGAASGYFKGFLGIWEVETGIIGDYCLAIAADPDADYTEPVVLEPFDIPELEQYPDGISKEFTEQLQITVMHTKALRDSYFKYHGAQIAGDSEWESKLFKECHLYQSMLTDDYRSLKKLAGPVTVFMQESGLNLTLSDVQNAKQNISQNGLPEIEVVLFKRLGYSDNEIEIIKEMIGILPDNITVNYRQNIIDGFDALVEINDGILSNMTMILGDDAPPGAEFNVSPVLGDAPLTVQFTDMSVRDPAQWLWDFGDNQTSVEQNPVHTYSNGGTYTVSLTVNNDKGIDIRTKYDIIHVITSNPPVADFTSDITSGKEPLEVSFVDLSTGSPTEWFWDFGDGTNSTEESPVHIYTAGNYSVSLTVSNNGGSSTKTMPDHIKVSSLVLPVADFSSNVTSGTEPLAVSFTDLSVNNPTSWAWSFGDGAHSYEQNPVHIYHNAGNYSVGLLAINGDGTDTMVKYDYIQVLPPLVQGKREIVIDIDSKLKALRTELKTMKIPWGTKKVLDVTLQRAVMANKGALKEINKNRERWANIKLYLEDRVMKVFEYLVKIQSGRKINREDARILNEGSAEIRTLIDTAIKTPI